MCVDLSVPNLANLTPLTLPLFHHHSLSSSCNIKKAIANIEGRLKYNKKKKTATTNGKKLLKHQKKYLMQQTKI